MIDESLRLPSDVYSVLKNAGFTCGDEINPEFGDWPPLVYAAAYVPELVPVLLDLGADINAVDDLDARSALMYIASGDAARPVRNALEALLSHEADVDLVDRHGYSALGLALAHQNGAVASRLLASGARISPCFPTSALTTPLMSAAQHSVEALPLLIDRGADPHEVAPGGGNVLHVLAHSISFGGLPAPKAVKVLDGLGKKGVEVEGVDQEGNTPLHLAADANPLMCQWLLRQGAKVDARNQQGLTPLMISCLQWPQITRLLLDQGARVHSCNYRGVDALMCAATSTTSLQERNHLAHYHRSGCMGKSQYYELLLAPSHRHPAFPSYGTVIPTHLLMDSVVPELLRRGADPTRRARDGSTALMRAARFQPEMLQVLLDAGAPVHARDRSGWTALMCASGSPRAEAAVEVLLQAGACASDALEKPEVQRAFQQNRRAWALLEGALLDGQGGGCKGTARPRF